MRQIVDRTQGRQAVDRVGRGMDRYDRSGKLPFAQIVDNNIALRRRFDRVQGVEMFFDFIPVELDDEMPPNLAREPFHGLHFRERHRSARQVHDARAAHAARVEPLQFRRGHPGRHGDNGARLLLADLVERGERCTIVKPIRIGLDDDGSLQPEPFLHD
jgi:hypothetical protein